VPQHFLAHDGQFTLDGAPQLIQAGEFHYFRTPVDQWPHRLGLLKQAGFNAVATYIPWLWHQLAEDVSDFDGHSHPMRDLAGFLDLAASMGLFIIARPGPYIMAETNREGIPAWVFENYPQVAFISQDGKAQNSESAFSIASYLHPDFLRCVRKWYRAVFAVLAPRQITRGGKIILVQLDNEMGMLAWVRNIFDVNADTLTRFATYLRESYGQRLAERYPVGNLKPLTTKLAAFLSEGITAPTTAFAEKIVTDYKRFYRKYLREYATFLWSEARANGMDVTPVINIHGFGNGGKTFPIGLSQLVDVMEIEGVISATDAYPLFIGEGNFHQLLLVNAMTKALQNPAQPLFSIEFQSGGNRDFSGAQSSLYDLHTRLSISAGMRAVNHYLFFDGENDPLLSSVKRHNWGHPVRADGTLRKHYSRYARLSRTLAAYGDALVRSQPKSVATIGFLLDHFMTEVNNSFTRARTDLLTHQREVVLFDFLARGLALTHRPFDGLELTRARLDATHTPILFAMMDKQCDAATQHKLAGYVRGGGRLILVGRMCEETFDGEPCTILPEAIGIQHIVSEKPFARAHICAFHHRDVPVSFLETYSGDFDEVFALSAEGRPVGFIKQVGKGQAMVLGAALAAVTLEDLDVFHQMALKMRCRPLFTTSEWADVRLSAGEQGSFLFVNNYQDDPIETRVACDGAPLFGGNPISLAARSGLILPLDWHARPGVTLHYATSEIAGIVENETALTLRTAQREFWAELTLAGYCCEQAGQETVAPNRIRLRGTDGMIVLAAS
jgi:beta-galactosidase